MRNLVVALCVLSLSACSIPGGGRPASYDPLSDARLVQQAARVPGIADVTIRFSSQPGQRGYRGRLVLDPALSRAQAGRAVDTVYAIVRQGQVDATIELRAVQDDRILGDLPGVPSNGTLSELASRYGPQPGDGEPPS